MANSKSMRRYVALTTLDSRRGWWVVAMGEPGEDMADVERRAMAQMYDDNGGDTTGIEMRTEDKNLQIVSYSAAKRAFPKAMSHYEYAETAGIPY